MSRGAGWIRVLPADVRFEVGEGESVFRAAGRQGVRWPSVCNGDCECGTCYMVVSEGGEHLSERSAEESARLALGLKAGEPAARLACRTLVNGEVTVVRRGVRWAR